tara:strand:- start:1222 stop:1482 length:261 start_codon:yes stop_codon:yes gene_type:complete
MRQMMSETEKEIFTREKWEEICHSLAPENFYEDGELNDYEAKQKYKSLMKRGKRLYDAGYFCPKNVYDMCDDPDSLKPFLKETNHE